mgnify:CR=1 FL=1
MQPIEIADILSTDLQLAHTGYLTHALCLQGSATLLFNGAAYLLQAGDCIIIQRSESAQIRSEEHTSELQSRPHICYRQATVLSYNAASRRR